MYNYAYSYILFFVINSDVRLVPIDKRPYSGRIEVFYNHEWGEVCFQENSRTLSIVCAQLGYGSGGAIPSSHSVSRNPRIWLSFGINCAGNEDTLFDCLSSYDITRVGKLNSGYCIDGVASVVCPIREFVNKL